MRLAPSNRQTPKVEIIPTRSSVVLRKMATGWHILEIRGQRDIPGWDRTVIAKGMTDPQKIAAEVDGDWSASSGKLVYPEFNPKFHVDDKPIPFDPGLPLLAGFDFGGSAYTGTPAFVPAQLNIFGQLVVWEARVPEDSVNMGIYQFGEWVHEYLCSFFGDEHERPPKDLRFYGDPAGRAVATATQLNAKQEEARSCWEILRVGTKTTLGFDEYSRAPIFSERPGFGWIIKPGEVSVTRRLQYMKDRFTTLTPDGFASIVIDPRATIIIDGLSGGYHFKQRNDGSFEHEPNKNWFSHSANALEYLVSRLPGARPLPDEDSVETQNFRSVGRSPGRREWT